jgi:hypothetical protein
MSSSDTIHSIQSIQDIIGLSSKVIAWFEHIPVAMASVRRGLIAPVLLLLGTARGVLVPSNGRVKLVLALAQRCNRPAIQSIQDID